MDGIRKQAKTPEDTPEKENPAATQGAPREERGGTAEKSKGSTLSSGMAGLLIGAALLFDGAQALAGVLFGLTAILLPLGIVADIVIDIIAWLTFFLWLHSLGLGMMKKGGHGSDVLNQTPFVIITLAFGIEFIPFLNILPAWTAAIVAVVMKERILSSLAVFVGLGGMARALGKTTGSQNKST